MDSEPDDRERREVRLARERPFRLGAVEVRPPTRELIAPRGRAVLEPRVMQVLIALARAEGEIVTRDDLIASCWEGRAVGEDAISRVISRLRKLSDGLGSEGFTLETVTKVGYRLLPAGAVPSTGLTPAAKPEARSPPRRTVLALAAGGAVVVATIAGGGLWWRTRRTGSPQVSALYDKGKEALRQGVPEQVAQAVGFLREAVRLAPDDARAWGALALAYQASLTYTEAARQPGVTAQAEAAARRALELDPDEPDGSAALALLSPVYRNWDAAEPLFKRAIALHPRQPALQLAYARLLLGVGRIRASVKASQAAVDADPFQPHHHHSLARSLWSAGRLEEAEQVLGKARGLWPQHYALWFLDLHLLAFTGRTAEALALGADTARRPASVPVADVELSLASVRAMQTRSPAEVASVVEAHTAAARRGAGYAEIAMNWLSGLGRMDEAFAAGRAMYFDGATEDDPRYSPEQRRFMVSGTRNTHNLFMPPTAPMRRDPRFAALMDDLGIGRYWKAPGHAPDDPAWTRDA